MNKVEIFDPAMCCSTGVCGPGIDPELLRVSTIINVLEAEGKKIVRYNLANEPQAFVDNQLVNDILISGGIESLPITIVDGEIKQIGSYPSNTELEIWTGKRSNASCSGCSC
jgi:hypothetical protein